MTPDQEIKKIRELGARVAEQFDDYLVLARVKGGIIWRYSDHVWGVGAAKLFAARMTDATEAMVPPNEE